MNRQQSYERFPLWIVVVCNVASWAIYVIGAYLVARLWIWLLVPYLLYCLWLEVRLLKEACVDCVYYGKACAFGKGKLCAMVFERGDPVRFAQREIAWTEVIPDFLVSIIPLLGGGVSLLVHGWSWPVVVLMTLLLVLAFGATALVRGSLACRYCRQKEVGCPAHELFGGRSDDQSHGR